MFGEPPGYIREACAEDAERCGEIAVLAWQPVFAAWRRLLGEELFSLHYGECADRKRQDVADFVRRNPEGAIVTVVDGVVVGFLTFFQPGPEGVGEIGNNAVHPDWQGLGIGVRQCRYVLEMFRERGLRSATVCTGLDEGHAPARAMYERAGFRSRLPTVRYYMEL